MWSTGAGTRPARWTGESQMWIHCRTCSTQEPDKDFLRILKNKILKKQSTKSVTVLQICIYIVKVTLLAVNVNWCSVQIYLSVSCKNRALSWSTASGDNRKERLECKSQQIKSTAALSYPHQEEGLYVRKSFKPSVSKSQVCHQGVIAVCSHLSLTLENTHWQMCNSNKSSGLCKLMYLFNPGCDSAKPCRIKPNNTLVSVGFCLQPHSEHDPQKSGSAVPSPGQTGGSRNAGGVRQQVPEAGTPQTGAAELRLLD